MIKKTPSFYHRIGKYVIVFTVLGVIAVGLTFLTVTLATYFGENMPVGLLYWNTNIFITFLIGFLVTPLVVLYVQKLRERTK